MQWDNLLDAMRQFVGCTETNLVWGFDTNYVGCTETNLLDALRQI